MSSVNLEARSRTNNGWSTGAKVAGGLVGLGALATAIHLFMRSSPRIREECKEGIVPCITAVAGSASQAAAVVAPVAAACLPNPLSLPCAAAVTGMLSNEFRQRI